MNKKQWLAAFVLFDFSLLNLYVLSQYGFREFFALAFANAATILVMVDLAIALGMVAIWMWNDAKERGISALPYLAVTMTLGSIGPLLYLLRTLRSDAPAAAPARLAAVRE
jgi:hypothetical protein